MNTTTTTATHEITCEGRRVTARSYRGAEAAAGRLASNANIDAMIRIGRIGEPGASIFGRVTLLGWEVI